MGYHVADILVDGISAGAFESYTFTEVDANHTLSAVFEINTYDITVTQGTHGLIEPTGITTAEHGSDLTYTITPDEGYYVSDVQVDGESMGSTESYTFTDVAADHTLTAVFAIKTYSITTNAGDHGTITPSETQIVDHGSDATFNISPNEGYHIADVLVDGSSIGAVSIFTFNGVTSNHTIGAIFAINTYTITPDAGENGSITPDGPQTVNHGSSATFIITPDEGYHITEVQVDGINAGNGSTYTFTGVEEDHTIAASFEINTYTLTPVAGSNGSISPSTPQLVTHGSSQTFLMVPAAGYHVSNVRVDGVSMGALTSYTFDDVTGDHTIETSFEINSYTILPSAGNHGSISPGLSQLVDHGSDLTFNFTPDIGYHVADVLVDGSSVGAVSAYTFEDVDSDHSIEVSFEINTYTLSPTAGANGALSPATVQTVDHGDSFTFTINPDMGYHIGDVRVDGSSVGAVSNFIFSNVTTDHTIEAFFEINTYLLTPAAGAHGSISPSTVQTVDHGSTQTFSIVPDEGYHIADVLVDGASVGPVTSYSFADVTSHHNISATFEINTYTILPAAGPHGSITPGTATEVDHGTDLPMLITPDQGYEIEQVAVDGTNLGPISSYTFTNVTESHTITATFRKVVEVTEVSIPNGTMKIGDVVSATITVTYDNFIPYTLLSGSVGGYPLTGLQRINPTTYLANFVINEGGNSYAESQDIPVENLVLSDGAVQSSPFNGFIRNDNDLLDAEYPSISGMSGVTGVYRIGSVVQLDISSDGEGYSILPGSMINGISVSADNVEFIDRGGGNYQLLYTVREGDNDAGPGELAASVVLAKPSGNIGAPYSQVGNAQNVTIDANPPVVTRMEVSDRAYGVGQTVQVAITADGPGYAAGEGTRINGIPLSSPRVSFSERSGGLYELSYVVNESDGNVAPGNLEIVLVVSDPAGNDGDPFTAIATNRLEIYTLLPAAVIAGTPQICEGDLANLTVYFEGRGPWSFELYDGAITTIFNDIASEDYSLTVTPEQTTTYSILRVEDVNGVGNNGSGSVQVVVNETTDVEFVNIAAGYSVEEDPVQLLANIPGGIFTGPGIIDPSGLFDPAIADTVGSPHTLLYSYTNENGCTSVATARVFVLGSMGGIYIPSEFACNNGAPFEVSASNVAGELGTFKLLNSNEQEVTGLTDLGNNTAQINPTDLKEGTYTIEYNYFDGVVHQLRKAFVLESVTTPVILNLTDDSYCQNITPFRLEADQEDARFTGPGVSASGNEFWFDPSGVKPGSIEIFCENVSEHGCSEGTQTTVEVLHAPITRFTLETHCIPSTGGSVLFDNLTPEKLSVESWIWNFGDPSSGALNESGDVNPTHSYASSGPQTITLTATTFDGCSETALLDTVIGTIPTADFTWISDCYLPGQATGFINRTGPGSIELQSLRWKFMDREGALLGTDLATSPADTIWYEFDEAQGYTIQLIAESEFGCFDSIAREIDLQPTIVLTDEGYFEGFDQGDGMWTVRSEEGPASWVLNEPDFTDFDAIPGDQAWHTHFPAGVVGYMEQSWVESPCFDFSDIDRGMIQMNVMRSFVPNLNGAVLQYREVFEEGWKTLGSPSSGVNWYNTSNLINRPGGSQTGWGLDVFHPDHAWVRTAHSLDGLDGKTNISFRIAIATTGAQGIGNQGFAFDEIFIGERSKLSVLEHFTNASAVSSRLADDLVDSLSQHYPQEIIDIQYHTDYPGEDPMNKNNPFPAASRAFYYGIQDFPYALLDGGIKETYRYDFPDLKSTPLMDEVPRASLELPPFEIRLTVDWTDTGLESKATVSWTRGPFKEHIQLYLVVFEREVSVYQGLNGDTLFRNVVLDMLPDPTGDLLGSDWNQGDSETRTFSWNYQPYVEDISDLGLLVFIQERATGKILQAAVKYREWGVGVEHPRQAANLHVYPNPFKDVLFVNLGRTTENSGMLRLVDMNGREVLAEQVPPGYQIYQMELPILNRGIYILYWYENGQFRGLSKVVKTE